MSRFNRVILITVDCLRADVVGCIGGGNLTPNIDRFAHDSILFQKAFANGPGTNQSFPAIMTSTYFLMNDGLHLSPRFATLAESLSRNGYNTAAFHSNPFLSKTFGMARGFDEFFDYMDIKSPSAFVANQQTSGLKGKAIRLLASSLGANENPRIQRFLKKMYYSFCANLEVPYQDGTNLNREILNWIGKNSNEPFFLWMHYMDPHAPYIPPEPFLADFTSRKEAFNFNISADDNNPSEEENELFWRLYRGEVQYTDKCIGVTIDFLRDQSLLDESLIIFTSDHGHGFMEHKRFGHAYDILYNEVIHVPLIVHGLDENKGIDAEVQLLDVAPTILNQLEIKAPPTFLGRSLLSADNKSIPIFSESAKPDLINLRYDMSKNVISCVKNGMKLILNELQGTKELYDLNRDPREKDNRYESEKELASELTFLIRDHLTHEELNRLGRN